MHRALSIATALLLTFTATLTGCAQDLGWPLVKRSIASDFPGVRAVTTDSLSAWLTASERGVHSAPLLLDAREPDEYAVSHLRGARSIAPDADPADELPSALAGVPKNAPIVLYCSVGYRSARLANRLQAAGFTDVQNLDGSIFQWANEGREVVRGAGADAEPVRAVHPYSATWGRLLDRHLRARPD